MSRNQRTFQSIVKKSGAAYVARVLGIDESTVRFLSAGKRNPSPQMREKLATFDARLSVDGWDRPAKSGQRPARAPRVPLGESAATIEVPRAQPGDGEARLFEVIEACDRLLVEASDPESHTSVRDRAVVLGSKAQAAARLEKLRLDRAVSEGRFALHPRFKAWCRELTDAFKTAIDQVPFEHRRGFTEAMKRYFKEANS